MTAEHVNGWIPSSASSHHWRQGQLDDCATSEAFPPPWPGGSFLPEEQQEAVEIQLRLGSLFKARQDVGTLPGVWRHLAEISRRQEAQELLLRQQEQLLQQQEQLLQQQQEWLTHLQQRLVEREQEASLAEPDEQQRWMMEHPGEVEKYRGQHVAVHATRGIVAAAGDYASLVEQLERHAVPDDEVVIEFIRPAPLSK